MKAVSEEWEEMQKEYSAVEETHKQYCKKVEEVKQMQGKCTAGIARQRHRMKMMQEKLDDYARTASGEEDKEIREMKDKFVARKNDYREMEEVLPHENGLYLQVVLGSVNVSLLSKKDKYKYKESYETFKITVTLISLIFAIILWLLPPTRVMDAAFQFLMVWYYCTLTIREHILKVNGSRIKGWWMTHHFVSTICAGILLIWPDGYCYSQFRGQFIAFSIYITLVQVAQFYYQKGCLYRLRALGEKQNMDITVEGFQSWMWKGLAFIIPFLCAGYAFQAYNAYVLYQLAHHANCKEWQVQILALVFTILFIGNMFTMLMVLTQKIKRSGYTAANLIQKYKFWEDKSSDDSDDTSSTNDDTSGGEPRTERSKDE